VLRSRRPVQVTGQSPTFLSHTRDPSGARRNVLGQRYGAGVKVRYRYRIYPGPGQQQALARMFGCARVVFNDAARNILAAGRADRLNASYEAARQAFAVPAPRV